MSAHLRASAHQQRASASSCACSTSAGAVSLPALPLRARQGAALRRPRTGESCCKRWQANLSFFSLARPLPHASPFGPSVQRVRSLCQALPHSVGLRIGSCTHSFCSPPPPPFPTHLSNPSPTPPSALRAFEPFSENAAQVKRLISRDRKQFLGNEGDILDKFETEFGDAAGGEASASAAAAAAPAAAAAVATAAAPAAAPAPPAAAPKPASPFGSSSGASPASPFGSSSGTSGSSAASPFGSAPGAALNARSKIEPAGLSPTLGPDPLAPAAPAGTSSPLGFLGRITLTQVVLFLSFSTIIGTMLATFRVAVNAGAIRLAGVE
jgi:hypothetical protein